MIRKFDKLDLAFFLLSIGIAFVIYFTNMYYLLQPIGILIAYALIITLRNVFKSSCSKNSNEKTAPPQLACSV